MNGTSYGHLRGRVVLCISQPTSVKDIKLHLEGRYYINWDPKLSNASHRHNRIPWKEVPFFHQISNLLPTPRRSSIVVLEPNNYEFPFEICLPKGTPESVQGVDDCFIRYVLRAEVHSSGGDNMTISKEVRVRKTYTTSLLREPSDYGNIWPEKIIYNASIPNSAVPFGSSIRINFLFIPLIKGVELDTIELGLIETHHITKPLPATRSREALVDKFEVPPWDDLDISPDDGYSFHVSRSFRLTKSTMHCLQSTATTVLQVKHRIAVVITLLNADRHKSCIRFSLPIFIYLRPPSRTGFYTLPESDTSDGNDAHLPSYDSHIHDMKPDELGLTDAPAPEYTQRDSNMEQDEHPPHCSITESFSEIPNYLATINSYC
ncbi:hypothetical protein SI65_05979 [Aspergillus cristatus]|uniref:Arrestin C-terminal-like domain-containing protein n=1 Tax=Aspergillus cristatus TaxID=573508 RepID=A0A1E3BEZ6_ASPCR|nr:hypothetical protein SI65_05979 [Aspergillus cristatus]